MGLARTIFKSILVGMTAAIMTAPALSGAAELAKNQNLKLGLPTRDMRTMDPALFTISSEKSILDKISNGLFRTPYGKAAIESIEPDLAEMYEVSPVGKAGRFMLSTGRQFVRYSGSCMGSPLGLLK